MNKFLQKLAKIFLGLSLAAGVGVAVGSKEAKSVSADNTITFESESDAATNNSVTKSGITLSGMGSYQSTDYRFFKGSTVTIESTVGNITSVSFTFTNGSNNGGWNGSTASYSETGLSTTTWTKTCTSGKSGKQARVTRLDVTVAASKTLSSISVADNSGKTWYAGDTVAASDLTVTVNYSSGDPAIITNGSGVYFDSSHTQTTSAALAQGSNTVTVYYTDTYGSASNSVSISALAAVSLSSIAITTAPTKTTYNEGEYFDTTGMVVTATYSDSNTANVTTSCTFTPSTSTALSTSDTSVTVSYTYKGIEKTATQVITVNAVQSATFTAGTDLGSTTGNNSPDSITKSGFTVSGTDAAFAAVSSGTYTYRIYGSSTVTFSVSSGSLGKITIVRNGTYAYSLLTLSSGGGTWNNSTGVWTGDSSSVTFSASAQFRANSFTLEKVSTTTSVEIGLAPACLVDGGDSGTLSATIANDNNYTITWSATPNTGVTFSPATSISGGEVSVSFSGTTSGTTPIVIKATLNDTGSTESQGVNVYSLEHAGTSSDPFTATDAQVFASDTYAGQSGGDYYVEGYVVGTYYNQSSVLKGYYIDESPTATSGTKFEVYDFTNSTGKEIIVADGSNTPSYIIAHGAMTSYNGQAEFSSSTITSVSNPNVPSIVIDGGNRTVDIGDSVTLTVTKEYDEGATVSWSSSDTNIISVAGGVLTLNAVGSADITASMTVNAVVYSNTITVTVIKQAFNIGDEVYFYAEYNSQTYYMCAVGGASSSTTTEADKIVFTVVQGSVSGSVAFKHGDYYLKCTSSSPYSGSSTTLDADTSWTALDEGTDVVITTCGSQTGRKLCWNYNNGAPRFGCYGTPGATILLVSAEIVAKPTTVTLDEHAITLENGSTTVLTYTSDNPGTFVWTSSSDSIATVTDGEVECKANSGTATIRIFYDTNGNGSYDDGEPTDTCVITATPAQTHFGDANYGGIATLLESDSSLAGKKVIFGRNAVPCVSGHLSGSMLTAVSSGLSYDSSSKKFTIGDGLSDVEITVFTITSVTGGYAFTTVIDGTTKYLKETSAKNVTYVTEFDSGCAWTIEIDNSAATITRVGGNALQYNASNPRFTTYSSSQSSIELYEYKSYYEEANEYAETFVGGSQGTCSQTISNWSSLSTAFSSLTTGAKNMYKVATHYDSSTYSHEFTLEHAVARYDDAVLKHVELQSSEFMHRFETGGAMEGQLSPKISALTIITKNTNSVAIIVIISMVSVTAIGGYFFLRKRKENI